ncbi:hypothetical protein B0G81_7117 [Paraburkholderia sp. BL6665CI2N2]|nr:hypothetical protein B0G81_7117 [Paraburkholderia sp. BL6665CI2N2]
MSVYCVCAALPFRFQHGENTALCFARMGMCCMSWLPHCRHELATAYARTTPCIGHARCTPCHASQITPPTRTLRTVRKRAPRTRRVLRRTIHVPRCIKTRRAPALPHTHAIRRKPPCHGLLTGIWCNWHRLCIKPCHRINVDPARVQHKVLAAGQVRTTASPNSVIDWVRGTPFLFPESFSPPAIRRRSQPAH